MHILLSEPARALLPRTAAGMMERMIGEQTNRRKAENVCLLLAFAQWIELPNLAQTIKECSNCGGRKVASACVLVVKMDGRHEGVETKGDRYQF